VGDTTRSLGGVSPMMSVAFESLIKMACFMTVYVFMNMYYGQNIKKSCKQEYSTKTIGIIILVGLILNILIETGKVPVLKLGN